MRTIPFGNCANSTPSAGLDGRGAQKNSAVLELEARAAF